MKNLLFFMFLFLVFANPSFGLDGEGYVNVDKASVRSGASKKYKILTYLKSNDKVLISEKKGQWYKIKYGEDKNGWISASLVRLVETSNIKVEFLNINDKFKKYFTENLLFLDRQLKGHDLSKVRIVVSYVGESNIARITLILPFDQKIYEGKKTKEISGSFIDFMVYNNYLWGVVKYKMHVSEVARETSIDDYQALMSFKSNILLIKENGDSIILSGQFSGGYVLFNPYVDLEFSDYKAFRVFTPDKESVMDKSVFYLPAAKSEDGKLTGATLLYNFFNLVY